MKPRNSFFSAALRCASTRQEKLAGCPATIFSSVSDTMLNELARSSSVRYLERTAMSALSTPVVRPRRLWSVARSRIIGSALFRPSRLLLSWSIFWNSSPVRAKNSPVRVTARKRSLFCASLSASLAVASPTSSGVGASTTTTIISKRPNVFSKTSSRLRHSRLGDSSALTSDVMAKLRAAYTPHSSASTSPAAMTRQA